MVKPVLTEYLKYELSLFDFIKEWQGNILLSARSNEGDSVLSALNQNVMLRTGRGMKGDDVLHGDTRHGTRADR